METEASIKREEVLRAVETVYSEVKRVHRELRPSDRIGADLHIDSLATTEILLTLESHFGVALLDDPAVLRVETVGDLVDLLCAARAGAA